VASVSWIPDEPTVGDEVTFTVRITNQGFSANGQTRFHYYVGRLYSGVETVPSIAATTTYSAHFNWTAIAESENVTIIIDPNLQVTESNEDNNELVEALTVKASDLIVQNMSWTPQKPLPGEVMTIKATVFNQGDGDAGSSQINFYVDDELLGSETLRTINASSSLSANFTWTVTDGSHTLKVFADSRRLVDESDEENNEKVLDYPVPPDLIIDLLERLPIFVSDGEPLEFTVRVRNQGQSSSDSFFIGIYIDANYVGYLPIDALEPGGSGNGTYTWMAKTGVHTFSATADHQDKIVEMDEANNNSTVSFTVSAASSTTETPSGNTDNGVTGNGVTGNDGGEQSQPVIPVTTPVPRNIGDQWLFLALGGSGLLLVSFILFVFIKRLR
jgi:subtilase family serine protease